MVRRPEAHGMALSQAFQRLWLDIGQDCRHLLARSREETSAPCFLDLSVELFGGPI